MSIVGPRVRALGGVLLLAATACSGLSFLKAPAVPRPLGPHGTEEGPAPLAAPLPATPDPRTDWGAYNNSYDGLRYSPLTRITPATAASLQPVCRFELHERAAMETGLVEVGGTIFVATPKNTYAFDAATCALRWKHHYDYSPEPPFDLKVNRGVAYLDGRVFRGANDGRVYALDARTGKMLWNVVAGDPHVGETFPAAPVAWHGLVFIGNAGGDNFNVTGRMMAFDARTGQRIWTASLLPRSGPANFTWPPATEVFPKGGGATWTSYAIDTAAGLVYVPTGNAAPDFLSNVRPGRNEHAYSVVALDAHTGLIRRTYQLLKHDFHDWDVAAPPALVTTRGGRRLIVEGGKDGHLYGIDPASGEFAFKTPVATIENADAPLTPEGTRYCPGVDGGVEWNGAAISRETNLAYVPSIDWCSTVKIEPAQKLLGKTGIPWTGSAELKHPFGTFDKTRRGWLTAVDLDDGRVAWRYASPTPLVAGVTTTAGGVVMTGDLNGEFLVFDAHDGHEVYRYSTGQPIGGGVISYAVDGRQYAAVAAGLDAPRTWQIESSPATVVVFGLGAGGAPAP
ncbi:MAG TPA: PQQ-binding-like beta-propeller repeat protein [Gemmatimonadales bacterium]|nr:PQQ-binding-like beta-propeller repeat protein [Gemmatimonadales bacterium]